MYPNGIEPLLLHIKSMLPFHLGEGYLLDPNEFESFRTACRAIMLPLHQGSVKIYSGFLMAVYLIPLYDLKLVHTFGQGKSRTFNVNHMGPDLQSGGVHHLPSLPRKQKRHETFGPMPFITLYYPK